MKTFQPFKVITGTSKRPTPSDFEYVKVSAKIEEQTREISDIQEITDVQNILDKMSKRYVNNVIQQTISQIVGQCQTQMVNLKATMDGALRVAPIGGGYNCNEVKSGDAPDSYGADISFGQECAKIDIQTWNNPCIFKISRDGVNWGDEFEIPGDFFYSLEMTCKAFNIKNKTTGSVCRYQANGFFSK